jgi:hypothetical protein
LGLTSFWGPSTVVTPRLLIKIFAVGLITESHFLHPQPEDSLCYDDRLHRLHRNTNLIQSKFYEDDQYVRNFCILGLQVFFSILFSG